MPKSGQCHYECTHVCPTDVWRAEAGGAPTVAYENRLERDSCRSAYSHGNVEWECPESDGGVSFDHGY